MIEVENEKNSNEKNSEVAVYALFRAGRVIGAPFFATQASLYPYVGQMLSALPFAYCVEAFRRSWSEVVGNIKKMAIFDPETGKFQNLDEPVIIDWSLFDQWNAFSACWSNIRKEDLPDECRDEKTGKFKLPC